MRLKTWVLGLGLIGLAAGCGDSALERGVTGGAIGAGVGEVVADEPGTGAAIGAGAGVLTN